MTNANDSLRPALSPAEQAAWDAAEKGEGKVLRADAVERGAKDAQRLRLFEILAHQNAGDARGALKATGELAVEAGPLDVCRRAERLFAARKRSAAIDVAVSPAEVDALAGGGPVERLIAARANLALGISAIQENEAKTAGERLVAARNLFAGLGSLAGRAVTETEIGKLAAWQGASEDAVLHLMTALNIWGAQGGERTADVWHEIGALLLDGRQHEQAVDILQSLLARDPSNTRTQNALVRGLIGAGRLDEAKAQAQDMLKKERGERERTNDPSWSAYREIMALRDLGEIAVKRAFGKEAAPDALAEAEQALAEGAQLLQFRRTAQTPVFPVWVRHVDGGMPASLTGETVKDKNEFEKLRLVQLELMIDAFAIPEDAGRNLSKLAESYSRRRDVFQELEAREQAANAFAHAGNRGAAARQLQMAHRVAMSRGQTNIARQLRARLVEMADAERMDLAPDGYVPLSRGDANDFREVITALDQDSGRRVVVKRYAIPRSDGPATEKAKEGVAILQKLKAQQRVLVGLPEILNVIMQGAKDGDLVFDLVTEEVEGERLDTAMAAEVADIKRPVRVIRSLSAAIQALHAIGIHDCRPDAGRVLLDLGDAPIWTELLPIYSGKQQDDDVKYLADMLVKWLGGGPGERSRLLWKGGKGGGPLKATVFPPGQIAKSIPAGLESTLTAILLGQGERPKTPGAFADELEKYC